MVRIQAFDDGQNPKPGAKRRNTSSIDDEAVPLKKSRGNQTETVSFYPEKNQPGFYLISESSLSR